VCFLYCVYFVFLYEVFQFLFCVVYSVCVPVSYFDCVFLYSLHYLRCGVCSWFGFNVH
jgi:hypothetical protein